MAVDVPLRPEILRVRALHLVGGMENSRGWEGTLPYPRLLTTPDGLRSEDGKPDRHYGRSRKARGYQFPDDWAVEIVNDRQVGVATSDDLEHIIGTLGIEYKLRDISDDPVSELGRIMAANLIIENTYERVYPAECMITGAYLLIGANGTILKLNGPHNGCKKVVTAICTALSLDRASFDRRITAAMDGRRGYMASVAMMGTGVMCVGDEVRVQPPIPIRGST